MAFALFRLQRLQSSLNYRSVLSSVYKQSRLISTSEKKSDTAICPADDKTAKAKAEILQAASKNWMSYGFDKADKETDRVSMHVIMFVSVTLCMVVGGFYWAYAPDINFRDWAQREAFLELRRREALGLPPVDPNLVDPAKLHLPSDEELGDIEILI